MMTKTGLLGVMLAGLAVGCANAPTDKEVLTIRLQAGHQNAGSMAQASLVSRGDATDITYLIGGVPVGVSRPLQLYTFIYSGTCTELSAEPAYSMNNTTQATPTDTGWRLSKEVPVALADLNATPHALIVRSSPADGGIELFCGDIRRK
ncbi:Uncharacterised protein [Halioglobus japonicus]|nr:Uncharacterised protein [Halioglobus japonicus]